MRNDGSLMDVPIRVHWQGWESDTYTLKRSGWEVFAHQEMARYEYAHVVQLALRDPSDSMVIWGEIKIMPELLYGRGNSLVEQISHVGMEMKGYRATDRIHVHSVQPAKLAAWDAMEPFDGLAYVPVNETSFRDLKLFKSQAPKGIYIHEASIDDCLNQALKLQFPERKRIVKGENVVRPVAQAMIYSVAG